MRAPPAASWSLARTRVHHALTALWFLVLLSIAVAFCATQENLVHGVLVAGAMGVAGLVTWRMLVRPAPWRQLQWDGARWLLTGDASPLEVTVSVPLQVPACLLVRVTTARQTEHWWYLHGSYRNPMWRALRRALLHT